MFFCLLYLEFAQRYLRILFINCNFFLANINRQSVDEGQQQHQLPLSPNWRGSIQNKNGDGKAAAAAAAAVSDDSIYLDSDIYLVARQDEDTLVPMYALLTLTLFVFALFINWFCKLRRGSGISSSTSSSSSSSSGSISNSRFRRKNSLYNLFGFK